MNLQLEPPSISFLWEALSNSYVQLALYIVGVLLLLNILILIVRKVLMNPARLFNAFHSVVLLITVPRSGKEADQQKKEFKDLISMVEPLFSNLGGLPPAKGWKAFFFGRHDHIALEIVAEKEGLISFFAVVREEARSFLEKQIHAQYPDALIQEAPDYNIFSPQGVILGTNLILEKNSIFPIKTYAKTENDPLGALTNSMSKIGTKNGAAIQILIRPSASKWHEGAKRVASEMQQGKKLKDALRIANSDKFLKFLGDILWGIMEIFQSSHNQPAPKEAYRLSPMEEEIVKSLEAKAGKAGFDVNLRVVASAENYQTAKINLDNIVHSFAQYGYGYGNSFRSVSGNLKKLINSFIYRHFDENKKFILNTEEMVTLYHLPLPTTETPNIHWLPSVKAEPPADLPSEGLILGKTVYRGEEKIVRIKKDDRRRHIYIIGQTGSGKSVLLRQMMIQDIKNGEGICVMDPHGELAEEILPYIPKERVDDVIYFDPSDTERPMGLNMLECKTDEQKDFVVGEMIAIFYSLFGEMIGPMFEHYMRNAMLALMEDRENGGTIIEIPRMFTDEEFRKEKLKKVKNPIVKNFWELEYEQSQRGQQAADMLSYLISKIGRILTNDMMRNIMGQVKSSFDFRDVMDNKKILLINLSKGKIGEINSNFLGMIIVSKLTASAMGRADMLPEQRKDFYLYMDEFHNFITKSIEVILSEARKYRLCLTIAHQYIGQLVKDGKIEIREAVFGNVGTKIAFRIGVEDAEVMAKEFAPVFNESDVLNVEKYTANVKLLIDNTSSRPFNMKAIYPPEGNPEIAKAIKELSRLKHGRDRKVVEGEIRERAKLEELGRRGGVDLSEVSPF